MKSRRCPIELKNSHVIVIADRTNIDRSSWIRWSGLSTAELIEMP